MFGWFKKKKAAPQPTKPAPQPPAGREQMKDVPTPQPPAPQAVTKGILSDADKLYLETTRKKIARKALRMTLSKSSTPPTSPFASWTGKVLVATPEETWPAAANGQPMLPLFQINLTELEWVPDTLSGIAMMTAFADEELDYNPEAFPNNGGCVLRTYASLDGLAEIVAPPATPDYYTPLPLVPKIIEADYPGYDDAPEGLYDWCEERGFEYEDLFPTSEGLKLGGYPFRCQSEFHWEYGNIPATPPTYAFQIDSENNAPFMWGDAGAAYFARTQAPDEVWYFDWQCY